MTPVVVCKAGRLVLATVTQHTYALNTAVNITTVALTSYRIRSKTIYKSLRLSSHALRRPTNITSSEYRARGMNKQHPSGHTPASTFKERHVFQGLLATDPHLTSVQELHQQQSW